MPILLQINICSNVLSTGKICEDIAKTAQSHGWQTYIAFGTLHKPSVSVEHRVAGVWNRYAHYAEFRLFDHEGLASRLVTQRLVRWIRNVNPDVIHLHNIHDHWLNYPILFRYLAKINKPVVWTQHDCWAFTGGCMYYDMFSCEQWKTCCRQCPEHRAFLRDATEMQYELKKQLLSNIRNLTLIPVSTWLEKSLKESHQKHRSIITVHNGIDINLFKPCADKKQDGVFRILGLASVWSKRKGLDTFFSLRRMLPSDFEITLVGLSRKQIESLPKGINGITRITDISELVQLYSVSDVLVNPTFSDNFPTVNLEALACGTPVITYNTGGSPEAVDENTGVVVEQGNVEALADAIRRMRLNPLSPEACRKRAEDLFDKDKCFGKYIELYDRLMKKDNE